MGIQQKKRKKDASSINESDLDYEKAKLKRGKGGSMGGEGEPYW